MVDFIGRDGGRAEIAGSRRSGFEAPSIRECRIQLQQRMRHDLVLQTDADLGRRTDLRIVSNIAQKRVAGLVYLHHVGQRIEARAQPQPGCEGGGIRYRQIVAQIGQD